MAEEPAPELTEAQQAKLAAKQFKAESRKLAKALKGKKPDPKLEAIDRCREDAAFLAKGECLVPLLQQCVFKKTKKGDNAEIVQAALSCARAFLEAAPAVPDEEEGAAATPEPPRSLLCFEAAEEEQAEWREVVCRLAGPRERRYRGRRGRVSTDSARRLALGTSIHT